MNASLVNLLIRIDVIPSNCNEVVSVECCVHVIEAQTMEKLVEYPAVVETTLEGNGSWPCVIKSLQSYLLVQTHVNFATSVADVR